MCHLFTCIRRQEAWSKTHSCIVLSATVFAPLQVKLVSDCVAISLTTFFAPIWSVKFCLRLTTDTLSVRLCMRVIQPSLWQIFKTQQNEMRPLPSLLTFSSFTLVSVLYDVSRSSEEDIFSFNLKHFQLTQMCPHLNLHYPVWTIASLVFMQSCQTQIWFT